MLAQFILKIIISKEMKDNKDKNNDKLASFNRLLPPIPTKIPKEVNKIPKYFKKNDQLKGKPKLYV